MIIKAREDGTRYVYSILTGVISRERRPRG